MPDLCLCRQKWFCIFNTRINIHIYTFEASQMLWIIVILYVVFANFHSENLFEFWNFQFSCCGVVGPSDFIASQVYSFTIIIIIVAIIISHNGNHYHYCHHHHHQNPHHYFDQWSPTTGLAVPLTCCVLLNKRVSVLQSFQRSKHLKGQLDLPVGNGNIFAPKEVSWTPLLVTVTILHQRRSVGPPCW